MASSSVSLLSLGPGDEATSSARVSSKDNQKRTNNDGVIQCVSWHLLTAPPSVDNTDWLYILKILISNTCVSKESEKLLRLVTLGMRINSVKEDGYHMKMLADMLWLLEVIRCYPELQETDKPLLEELITETQCQMVINCHEYGHDSKAFEVLSSYFQNTALKKDHREKENTAAMENSREKEVLAEGLLQVLKYGLSNHPYHREMVQRFLDQHTREAYCSKMRDFVSHLVSARLTAPLIYTEFRRRTLDDLETDSPDLLTAPSADPSGDTSSNPTTTTTTTIATAHSTTAIEPKDDHRPTRQGQSTSIPSTSYQLDQRNEAQGGDGGGDYHMEESEIFGDTDDDKVDNDDKVKDKVSPNDESYDSCVEWDSNDEKDQDQNQGQDQDGVQDQKELGVAGSSKPRKPAKKDVETVLSDDIGSVCSWSDRDSDDDFQPFPRRSARCKKIERRARSVDDDDKSTCSTPAKTIPEPLPRIQLNFREEHLHTTKKDYKPAQYKRSWKPEEEEYLKQGVKKYGEGQWIKILHAYPFSQYRTNVHLKDKWRNMTVRTTHM